MASCSSTAMSMQTLLVSLLVKTREILHALEVEPAMSLLWATRLFCGLPSCSRRLRYPRPKRKSLLSPWRCETSFRSAEWRLICLTHLDSTTNESARSPRSGKTTTLASRSAKISRSDIPQERGTTPQSSTGFWSISKTTALRFAESILMPNEPISTPRA